ncbi:MAG TPA: type II TA system antitoxin MqsA family protein [Acidobacteriota bacterium]|jgi:putative zinc finger/helix-turn-helix YgiT family protein
MKTNNSLGEISPSILSCPNCDSNLIETQTVEHQFKYGVGSDAAELVADLPVRICKRCNLKFLDEAAEVLKHEAICRHLGVLTPAEIMEVRQEYQLSRAEFCEITKIGEATLGRWERGALIQNAANDQFLCLLKFPENLERLKQRSKGCFQKDTSKRFKFLQPDVDLWTKARCFRLRRLGA